MLPAVVPARMPFDVCTVGGCHEAKQAVDAALARSRAAAMASEEERAAMAESAA